MNKTLKSKLVIVGIWVGLCFIPVVGPTLSSLFFVYNVFLAPKAE